MVYCGKPSRGCGECRSRRIKCNQLRPVCSQCTRANRACPGYRDQLSLLFRDESQEVARKARAAGRSRMTSRPIKRKRSEHNFRDGADSDETRSIVLPRTTTEVESQRQQQDCGPLMHRSISAPLQEQATNFVFANFAWLGVSLLRKGMLFTPELEDSLGRKALMAAVASVGYATLSNIHNSPSLNMPARESYISALRLVNAALADPSQAKTDMTFTASMLLAIFEVVTCKNDTTIDNWTGHVSGATALFQLQGAGRLEDESGMRMFSELRNRILISCLQTKRHVPPFLTELSERAALLRGPEDTCIDRLTNIVAKLCNLRANIASKVVTENSEIFSTACAIECDLVAWVTSLPSSWAYNTVVAPRRNHNLKSQVEQPYPYDGRYHIYGDLWICNAWNNYRATRILVNEIILTRLRLMQRKPASASFPSEFGVQCRNIRATLRQLAVDICYSVPYVCGDVDGDGIQVEDVSFSKASIGGFMILWPLFLAASVDGYHSRVGEWAVGRFYRIGRKTGIGQALVMIDILGKDTGIVQWVNRMDQEMHTTGTENMHLSTVCNMSIVDNNPWWDWEMVQWDRQSGIAR